MVVSGKTALEIISCCFVIILICILFYLIPKMNREQMKLAGVIFITATVIFAFIYNEINRYLERRNRKELMITYGNK